MMLVVEGSFLTVRYIEAIFVVVEANSTRIVVFHKGVFGLLLLHLV